MSAQPRHVALAHRLVLARLTRDEDAYDIILHEVGDCPDCWRGIAEYLAAGKAGSNTLDMGHDKAINHAETAIAWALDLEAES